MPFESPTESQLLVRVAIAAALAAAVGWEREHAGKSAGLRTHIIVGMAAALYSGIGELSMARYSESDPNLRADPIRVVQAVALGIGFLGGGVISAGSRSGTVTGLTTAASVWSTAAIGIATALGYYVLAVGATVLQLVVLHLLGRWEGRVG